MREERLEELAEAVDRLTEQLFDAGMELLRAALEEQGADAAAIATKRDRLIGRSRSSLQKASRLLRDAARAEADSYPATAKDAWRVE
jgi:hypothetical protein